MRMHVTRFVFLALTGCAGGASAPTGPGDASTDDPTTAGTTTAAPTTSSASSSGASNEGSGGSATGGSSGESSTGETTDLPPEPEGDCRELLAWSESEPFADDAHVSHPLPSFARAGFYYVHTMHQDGSDRRLLFAALGPDGAPGPWQEASPDHGGGPHGFTAVVAGGEAYHFRNGHIARFVFAADGTMPGDVELLEDSVDTAFGGNKYVWDSAIAMPLAGGEHVLHLGGFSFTGYTYRPDVYRSPVPVAASFSDTGLDHPSGGRPGKSVFYGPPGAAGGHVFTGRGDGPELWRGDVGPDGALLGLTHVRTSVNYPQSNGKIERYHRTLDKDTIQAVTPDGARATIAARIDHYNNHRLHSAIGYVSPRDKLLGLDTVIWSERDRKLEQARELRRKRRELDRVSVAA